MGWRVMPRDGDSCELPAGVGRWALGVGSWELGVGRWALGVGRWALGVGTWDLGLGSWELEVGSWKLGVGSWDLMQCYSYRSAMIGFTLMALRVGIRHATSATTVTPI